MSRTVRAGTSLNSIDCETKLQTDTELRLKQSTVLTLKSRRDFRKTMIGPEFGSLVYTEGSESYWTETLGQKCRYKTSDSVPFLVVRNSIVFVSSVYVRPSFLVSTSLVVCRLKFTGPFMSSSTGHGYFHLIRRLSKPRKRQSQSVLM